MATVVKLSEADKDSVVWKAIHDTIPEMYEKFIGEPSFETIAHDFAAHELQHIEQNGFTIVKEGMHSDVQTVVTKGSKDEQAVVSIAAGEWERHANASIPEQAHLIKAALEKAGFDIQASDATNATAQNVRTTAVPGTNRRRL